MKNRDWIGMVVASCLVGGCVTELTPPDDDEGDAGTSPTSNADTTPGEDQGDDNDDNDDDAGMTGGTTTGGTTTGSGTTGDDDDDGPPPIKLDVSGLPDGGGGGCIAPPMASCDNMDDDPWHAIGLNCPGGPQVNGQVNLTGAQQLYVHSGNLGTFMPPPFPPREGNKFVILSSGNAQDLTVGGLYASTSVGFGATPLPAPIQTTSVSAAETCADNPALIGTGDCSNTIEDQWNQGNGSFDYAEMRFSATVPPGMSGFSYDFAMFSTEYPVYYQSSFNDMYIAWLESEQWTGNISFDDMGNPISLNAGFLDYKDAPNMYDCPAPCQAPELQGTAMVGHAGTRWLTTTAGVVPGEDMELVLGVFDLSDSILDTVIILDNFQWGCDGGVPVTIPG